MELLKKITPAFFETFINKHFPPSTTICLDTGDFTFPPSKEFIRELTDSFTLAKIEKFSNGAAFSAYHVNYFVGAHKGEAIFKTTTLTYPSFSMYDTVEEYERSFSEE